MVAHKTSLINGLCRAHSVRSDSTHPDSLGFETVWTVGPSCPPDRATPNRYDVWGG